MRDQDQIEALLDLVDETRTPSPEATRALVVLGLAVRQGRGFKPTQAGWNMLGDRGRGFHID